MSSFIKTITDGINQIFPRTRTKAVYDDDNHDLDTLLTGKVDVVSGKQLSTNDYTTAEKNKLSGIATGATSVSESTVSGWGFTKNTGTYSKPASGIPSSDMTTAVQTSLSKADSALQQHQDISGLQEKLIAGTNITIAADGKTISATGGGSTIPTIEINDSKYDETTGAYILTAEERAAIENANNHQIIVNSNFSSPIHIICNKYTEGSGLYILSGTGGTFESDDSFYDLTLFPYLSQIGGIFNDYSFHLPIPHYGDSDVGKVFSVGENGVWGKLLSVDSAPTSESENLITSGGVYSSISGKQDKTDNTLATTSKTVVGAIGELKGEIVDLQDDQHTHTNKSVLDGITQADVTDWNGKPDIDDDSTASSSVWSSQKISNVLNDYAKYVNWTITVTDADTTQPTGFAVSIYNGSTLVETKTYNGQPVTFKLVKDIVYKVVPTGSWQGHFNPTPAQVEAVAVNDASYTFTYTTLASLSTFTDVKAALNAGAFETLTIGTEVKFTHATEGELVYEIVDKNSTDESVILLQKNPFNSNMPFDEAEALYYADSQLTAGSYYFTHSNTNYYFTLSNAVPQGGQISATTSSFTVYATPETTTSSETGSVSTTAIEGATSLGTAASAQLNHMDRVNQGNNNYYYSNIRQWLNSNQVDWFQHTHKYDRPPSYGNKAGFLAGVPADVLAVIETKEVKCSTNNLWEDPNCLYPKQTAYTVQDKFFLPSNMEIFGSYGGTQDGSTVFEAYDGATEADRIKYTKGTQSARYWWMRSPSWNSASDERSVLTSGSTGNSFAYYGHIGVVPACEIKRTVV